MASDASPELKRIIPERYSIERELGVGGMATVYLAHDSQNARQVALKVLHSEQHSPERKARFVQEYEILARLSHPGVAAVYELHQEEDKPLCFSMQYVNGTALAKKLSDSPLAQAEAIALLTNLAKTLHYIHTQGIVYADLSPHNVILRDGSPVLIDFGISRFAAATHTTGLEKVGTDLYMSPEQIRGEQLDARSDVYSFGVLAYQILTGVPPYAEGASRDINAAHLVGRVPLVRERAPDISPGVEKLIAICMQKERRHRYKAMSDVISRLAAHTTSNRSLLGSLLAALRGPEADSHA